MKKFTRRQAIAAATAIGMTTQASAMTSNKKVMAAGLPDFDELQSRFEKNVPGVELALEVIAKTGASHDLGEGANGRRRLVEITGGTFRGKNLTGVVLPGGTDRQLFRADGIRELDARYELKADDGSLLFVHNNVLIDSEVKPQRYARSVVRVEAPQGRHDWLNKRLLVGTLDSLRPEQPFVYLRFFTVN